MNGDWQTWTAMGIVALTIGLLVVRALARRKRGSDACACGSGGCGPVKRPRAAKPRR